MDLRAVGGWPTVLGLLTTRTDLDSGQARAAMAEILAGDATPAQVAGFIVALRMKGETVDELTGLVGAMLDVAERVPLADPANVLDIVGTGGDRAHTINVSTLASLVAAGAGARVCKHGNRAASSACGTADVLEALGVAIDLGPDGVAACVQRAGMGFCFAPRFHASMRHAGPTRRELGVPTVFNFLGPMANPARVGRQVIGVADPAMAERMLQVLRANGAVRALVVHGGDGLDELTTTGPSRVLELHEGELRSYEVDPANLGFERADAQQLRGGDAARNAELATAVLGGERGAHRDIVVLNAAAGLMAADIVEDFPSGIEAAKASIDEGRAAAVLSALVEVSGEEAARSAAG